MVLTATPGRRGVASTVTVRAVELDELRMEVRAAGQEMRAAGLQVQAAIANQQEAEAMQIGARLIVRGEGYAKR